MKNHLTSYAVLGLAALLVSGSLWAQSPKSEPPTTSARAWQHLALEHPGKDVTGSPELARKINSLGDDGWELVDVEAISESGATTKIIFFFKRPK